MEPFFAQAAPWPCGIEHRLPHRTSPAATAPVMSPPHVIATVVVGDRWQRLHRQVFRPSLEKYAARHGYRLLTVESPLVAAAGTPARESGFSKYLIASLAEVRRARRVLYVDADMLVAPSAPAFHTLELGQGIGVVDEWAQPAVGRRVGYQRAHGFEESPGEYYALAGFDRDMSTMANGGMFICEPALHGDWLADLAQRHAPVAAVHPRGVHYEQASFGASLEAAGLATWLPSAWNRIWSVHRWAEFGDRGPSPHMAQHRLAVLGLLRRTWRDSFLLHLTGGIDHDLAALLPSRASAGVGSSGGGGDS